MVERDGLENRCTGNRTVGSKSHPLRHALLIYKSFLALLIFQGTNAGPRLTLGLRPGDDTTILAKLDTAGAHRPHSLVLLRWGVLMFREG